MEVFTYKIQNPYMKDDQFTYSNEYNILILQTYIFVLLSFGLLFFIQYSFYIEEQLSQYQIKLNTMEYKYYHYIKWAKVNKEIKKNSNQKWILKSD